MLNGAFREAGMGVEIGKFTAASGTWDAVMATQNFAKSGTDVFLTGVAFDDLDGDRLYDIGEGLGATVKIANSATGFSTELTTSAAGGYSLALAAGTYSVTFSAAGYVDRASTVTIGTSNMKLDWVDAEGTATTATLPAPSGLTLTGTIAADTLTGGALSDVLSGLAGNDKLDGAAGADQMSGGLGDDTFYVDNAGDVVVELAGEGNDLVFSSISYALSDNVERLTLGGSTSINGTGNLLANIINGNAASNLLAGLDGNDSLYGLAGNDRLDGGTGNDLLVGGAGTDMLTGGLGADRFVWESASDAGKGALRDIVTDFAQGIDKLDLSGIDAMSKAKGNNAFTFIGEAAFSGLQGQLRFEHFAGTESFTLIQGDVNGDRVADFEIRLDNTLVPLTSSDFVL
jgi:Ca2+-binding RTX toxin-like protein